MLPDGNQWVLTLGIVEYFSVDEYPYVAETLYLEAGEPTLGYAVSAQSAAILRASPTPCLPGIR